jgi:hypothetical protein
MVVVDKENSFFCARFWIFFRGLSEGLISRHFQRLVTGEQGTLAIRREASLYVQVEWCTLAQ